MPLEQGFLLHNRYRIEQTIAVGGMGAIYRAQDETLRISVAVKENFFTTDEFSRQFRREATILAGLRHPNLPRVTDHFVIPGQGQYLVMDFIEGTDLREIINQRGAQDEKEVICIGVTVCNALPTCTGAHRQSSTATSNRATSRSRPMVRCSWSILAWPRFRMAKPPPPGPRH
jgi:serine/threonine-protein kinase